MTQEEFIKQSENFRFDIDGFEYGGEVFKAVQYCSTEKLIGFKQLTVNVEWVRCENVKYLPGYFTDEAEIKRIWKQCINDIGEIDTKFIFMFKGDWYLSGYYGDYRWTEPEKIKSFR